MNRTKHKWNFPVGMRVIKTVIAVFVCGLLGVLRGVVPAYAMCAAVICMQNSAEKTVTSGVNRLLGTTVGGVFGIAVVFFCMNTWAAEKMSFYYLVMAVSLAPIILITLWIKRPSIAGLSCVVFIGIAASQGAVSPVSEALNRLLDTFIGVVVTIVVDLVLPYHKKDPRKPTLDVSAGASAPDVDSHVDMEAHVDVDHAEDTSVMEAHADEIAEIDADVE